MYSEPFARQASMIDKISSKWDRDPFARDDRSRSGSAGSLESARRGQAARESTNDYLNNVMHDLISL